MEIAFFRAGMTRAASDQSISMGAASGSFATALAISSSVSLSTRAQSVLPLRRSPHFRVTILSFFILVALLANMIPITLEVPAEGQTQYIRMCSKFRPVDIDGTYRER